MFKALNQQDYKLKGTNINWYSNNKKDFNGCQFIIVPYELNKNLKANIEYGLYVDFIVNGEAYSEPLNINGINVEGMGNIKTSTKNNQLFMEKTVQIPVPTPKPNTTGKTIPPIVYNANNVQDISNINGAASFNYQGVAGQKTLSIVGGTVGEFALTPFGTNEFYGYYTPPNQSEKQGIYYKVSFNGGLPKLDPQNTNVGLYKGEECSYFLFEPTT